MARLGGRERGILALLGATFFWGASIVGARVLLRQVSPVALSHLGALVSAAALLVALALVAPQRLRIELHDVWRFAVLGALGFGLGSLCINVGIKRTSAATAATLQYVAPALTLLYGWLSRTEKVDTRKVAAVVLAILGAALATGALVGQFIFDPLGILAALGSATCFAFITIFSKPFASRYDSLAFTGYAFAAMALFYFLVAPWAVVELLGQQPRAAAGVALYAVALGVVPTVLYFYSLRHVAPTTATVVLSFEIVVASSLGWLLLGEPLAAWQIVGGAIVIAAVVLMERSQD